ncbi:MAG: hypothetical protein JXR13_06610 [Thalassovita sp.]
MSQPERSSALGPVLFAGLSIFVLANQKPPEIIYADPAETMDLTLAYVEAAKQHLEGRPITILHPVALTTADGDTASEMAPNGANLATASFFSAFRKKKAVTTTQQVVWRAPAPVALSRQIPARVPMAIPTEPPKVPDGLTWLVVSADRVHLRHAPNIRSGYITLVDQDVAVIQRDQSGNWIEVEIPSLPAPNTGWMWGKYLRPQTP